MTNANKSKKETLPIFRTKAAQNFCSLYIRNIQQAICFSKRDLFVFPLFCLSLFVPNKNWIYRILAAAITAIIALTFVKFGQLLAKKHTQAVREISTIFSLAFCIITALMMFLTRSGAIDQSGNPTNRLGHYFFKLLIIETNLPDGLKISTAIFIVLVASNLVSGLLCWYLKAGTPPDEKTKKTYICFGLYFLYQLNDLNKGGIQRMWFSLDPTKLFTVLVMKCFCAATAGYASMNFILLALYPSMAKGLAITSEKAIFFVSMLGIYTLLTIYINEEVPGFTNKTLNYISKCADKLKPFLSK